MAKRRKWFPAVMGVQSPTNPSGNATEVFLGKGLGTSGTPNNTIVSTPPAPSTYSQPDYTVTNTGRTQTASTASGLKNQRANH